MFYEYLTNKSIKKKNGMKCFQVGQIECMAKKTPIINKTDGKPETEARPI